MKKAKYIIKKMNVKLMESCRKVRDIHVLSRLVLKLAIVMSVIAIGVVLFYKPARVAVFKPAEVVSVVEVKSGDTLSKILGGKGFTMREIDTLSRTLKKDANFVTLRPGRDKFEFIQKDENQPISKIVIMNGPWNRVELSCGETGTWECQKIDIVRDTRIIYKEGEILDGDSFYLAGMRAGIPAGILADVYDLLAFEMDFERDVRAGQKFYHLTDAVRSVSMNAYAVYCGTGIGR